MTNTYSALLFSIRLKQAATIIFTLSLICLLTVFTKYDNHVTRVTSFHVLFTMGLFLSWAIHRLELSKRLQFLKQLEVLEGQSRLARSEKKRANWLENTTNFLRHELRNSIRGISSSIEMFKRFHPEYEDDKYLKRSNHSINLSNRLLSNVGDAAALESQLVNEEKCILDLGELVEDYANIIDFSSDKCRVEVKRSTKASPVYANNERLIQALDNLLGNAFDHANPGSAIRLKISVDKHLVCLSVENEGRPLPDDKDIIFQAFVSKRGNETYNQNNMGIGLYMVKTIIEAYDGEVIAESLAQGEGAKFTIQLPLA